MFSLSFSRNFIKLFPIFGLSGRSRGPMSGQKTLMNFFSPVSGEKRRSTSGENAGNENKSSKKEAEVRLKKTKTSEDTNPSITSPTKEKAVLKETQKNQTNIPFERSPGDKSAVQGKMEQAREQTKGLVNSMGPSWFRALEAQFSKPYFLQLSEFVSNERAKNTVFPPVHQVFSWTEACEISKVKVVILGQDPYHNVKQAHGFAFSVQKGITPPPSLVNMYKELETDIEGFQRPGHGDLTGWASQGVLLLNAVLTVRAHNANSHKDRGWEKFTDAVIAYISERFDNVVFILWGAYAQKKGAKIKKNKHLVLTGPHPSPLSAHRGFFGCKHFSKANDYLVLHSKRPVDWCDL